MAATARRIEQSTTPRPSVSPLSTASKPNRSSPIATRDAIMAERAEADDTELDGATNAHAENGELDDDRSSSLSEPEDDHYDDELENDEEDEIDEIAEAPERSLDADSEAETERLEQTPLKSRRHAEGTGRTPSKLVHATTMDDELSDPPSPLPAGVGATSSTSTVATAGQKRKRSETAESSLTSADSDLGESPRKRSHEAHPEVDEATTARLLAGGALDSAIEESVEDVANGNDESLEHTIVAQPRGPKGRRGKQKGRKAKDIPQESTPIQTEETAEIDEEPTAESLAKTEEEQKHKSEASTLFEELAKQFTSFRARLYNERLETLTAELNLLSQPDCAHPEYVRQVAAVDARLEKQTREAHAFYKYRLQCIKERTLGERSQLLSQYFQEVRDVRERVMYQLGEDWYNIQKERRQTQQDKDESYIYKFPTKKSVQIRQQAKYNQEVSVLGGMAKYVGFPAAPEIHGAQPEGADQDLKAMRIARRAPQPATQPQAPPYMARPPMPTISAQSERLAHEQFIEQNAWARPQPSIHSNHGTPGATHTLDWVDQSQSTGRNNVAHGGTAHMPGMNSSPFTTPLPDKRLPMEHSSAGTVPVNSDGPEPPSSVQPMPPTTDRLRNDQTSPLHVMKSKQNGPELTGFRNFSNISGASTIDAPETERERETAPKGHASLLDTMAQHQAFDTSQLHRQDGGKEVHASSRFRAQDGAFGTPAPLPTANAQ